jgi:hypothetical protein
MEIGIRATLPVCVVYICDIGSLAVNSIISFFYFRKQISKHNVFYLIKGLMAVPLQKC